MFYLTTGKSKVVLESVTKQKTQPFQGLELLVPAAQLGKKEDQLDGMDLGYRQIQQGKQWITVHLLNLPLLLLATLYNLTGNPRFSKTLAVILKRYIGKFLLLHALWHRIRPLDNWILQLWSILCSSLASGEYFAIDINGGLIETPSPYLDCKLSKWVAWIVMPIPYRFHHQRLLKIKTK